MRKSKLILILMTFLSCIVIGTLQLHFAKHKYTRALEREISAFLAQQSDLLQKIARQVSPNVHERNYAAISEQLRILEDQNFVFAKHGLAIPINAQWITLNLPAKLVNSAGSFVVPHQLDTEDYYHQLIADPEDMQISSLFIKPEMPEHALINLGRAVNPDAQEQGYIEFTIAMQDINHFIADQMLNESKLFSFEIHDLQALDLRISLDLAYYTRMLAQSVILILCSTVAAYVATRYLLFYFRKFKNLQIQLIDTNTKVSDLQKHINLQQAAEAVQISYALLVAGGLGTVDSRFDLYALLEDAVRVNLLFANMHGIKVELPCTNMSALYITTNKLRLMQIVSGIIYAILKLLPAESILKIQVSSSEQTDNIRRYTFQFTDNGFYNALPETDELTIGNDVRIKGWHNIRELLAYEGAILEHTHMAYAGNTISFSLLCNSINNVVHLEEYFN